MQLCDKNRYASKEEALATIEYLMINVDAKGLSTYKCQACHNYHLTSKENYVKKKRKRTQ